MHILTLKLAQDIVERTMKIIPFNVNVMDAHGTILASGDASRIGELHSGALLALAKKTTIEIDMATAKNMHGAKPGVNLPLTVNGELCGAVGLSGAPRLVRQFGELVKLTAEMILEQASLTHELQRDVRYREAFLRNLIHFESSSSADLYAWGQRLSFDFERMHLVFLVKLQHAQASSVNDEIQQLQMRILARQPDWLTATITPREIVILDSYRVTKNKRNANTLPEQHLRALRELLDSECMQHFTLSMGMAATGLAGIRVSYHSAKTVAQIGHIRHPQQHIYDYYELTLPVLLSGLDAKWQAEQLRLPFSKLQQQDKDNKMLEQTVKTWFEHNENAAQTAGALGIHRNSLDYRLKRVEEITGLNLTRTDERFLLYVSYVLVVHEISEH